MSTHIHSPFEPPEIGEVKQIADGILWTRLPLPPPLGHVNSYMFADDDGWTIVDTGVNTKETREVWRSIIDTHFMGRPIVRLIGTHHHLDHIGLAGWFMRKFGATLYMSRTAYLMARMLYLDKQERPPAELLAFWRSCGMRDDLYQKREQERPFNTSDAVAEIPLGFERLNEGTQMRFAGRDWEVRMGEGHAPEHVTLWSAEGDYVIAGDQLISSISSNLGVVLSGHKTPFKGLPARLDQLIENHESGLRRLYEALKVPMTACECFDTMFKRKIGAGEYGLAMVEAMAHCRHLEAKGLVIGVMREDGALVWEQADQEADYDQ